jgi:UPF0755 protein
MDPLQALQQELKRKETGTVVSVSDGVQGSIAKQGILSRRFFTTRKRALIGMMIGFLGTCVAIAGVAAFIISRPPTGFPVNEYLEIKAGNFDEVSTFLESKHVIRSPLWFKFLARLTGSTTLKAGLYSFEQPLYAPIVLRRVAAGFTNVDLVRVTIPEGFTVAQVADVAHKAMPRFNTSKFISLAKQKEGYLFPETYLVLPNISERDLMDMMLDTYKRKTKQLQADISRFGKPERDIVIMASILEEEGNTPESRRMIADILWRRVKIGMPLQVDATFLYINGKKTYELTKEDLRSTSPYNTYMYKGLPPGPISNPGLDSIQAALQPAKNEYWYYLSDKHGNMYYAETYNEHLDNKARYIR